MYVRVSTSQQREEATIESQKKALFDLSQKMGFEIPLKWIFEDNGVSGSTLVRPALERFRDFISEELIETVFILSPDRLSRKYAYQALLIEEFARYGVKVIFQNSPNSEKPEDNLLLQMQGMFAEYERAQISERSRRGKKHKALKGSVSVLSKAPYGYRYVKGSIAQQAYFEVVDNEARVIQTIFELYSKGKMSIREIKKILFEKGIFSPTGNPVWAESTLLSILKNSAYRGLAYYGKREKILRDPNRLTNRKLRLKGKTSTYGLRERNKEEWLPIPVPAIIDEETYELAQELLLRNKTLSKRNTKEGTLLQGLIVCGECGYAFTVRRSGRRNGKYQYYRCNKRGKSCTNPGIIQSQLDENIWKSLFELLKSPELIKQEVVRRLSELKEEPLLAKKRQIELLLLKLEEESNRLLDAYQEGYLPIDQLRTRMDIIKRELNNNKRRMEEFGAGIGKKQLLELEEVVQYFSEKLKSSEGNLTLPEKRKILRMLVKEIVISKDGITVNHILPLIENDGKLENACFCPTRRGL